MIFRFFHNNISPKSPDGLTQYMQIYFFDLFAICYFIEPGSEVLNYTYPQNTNDIILKQTPFYE